MMDAALRSLDEVLLERTLARVAKLADRRIRQQTAAAYAEVIRSELPMILEGAPGPAAPGPLADFAQNGSVSLGSLLSPEQARDVVAYLSQRPCYPGHVARTAQSAPGHPDEIRKTSHYGSYALADVVGAPWLLELANHPRLLSLAAGYLDCMPSLYSINCFWSFAGHAQPSPIAQRFHRDPDDFRFCTAFAFLTDVDAQTCPHSYVLGSQDYRSFDALLLARALAAGLSQENAAQLLEMTYLADGNAIHLDPYVERLLPDRISKVTGPAGTCFLEDTFGLHKGTNPTAGDRLVFWARYGLGRNLAYLLDQSEPLRGAVQQRLPATPASRYINRLVVQW